jgi:hypothetical protein
MVKNKVVKKNRIASLAPKHEPTNNTDKDKQSNQYNNEPKTTALFFVVICAPPCINQHFQNGSN